jgi:cytochrome P450
MTEQAERGLTMLDVLTPEGVADPYPIYARFRSRHPVYWDSQMQRWVITNYADVVRALTDIRFCAMEMWTEKLSRLPAFHERLLAPIFQSISRQMLLLDPPDHTRIRGLVHRAFTPRTIGDMRPRIQELVDGLLDDVAPEGRMEVNRDLALPLPAIVISEILGVPPDDRIMFQRWSEDFAAVISGPPLPDQDTLHLSGVRNLVAYLRGVVEAHRRQPRDDLLQTLVDAEQEGDRLSEDELLANAVLLIAAGHITTTRLIANGIFMLLRQPQALELLVADPSLITGAVEETLRFESPIQATIRRLSHDVDVAGNRLRAGQIVQLHLGAANRDPKQFDNPNAFDVTRPDNHHVAFGQGVHFCLGAVLARLESQIAISSVLARFPDMRLHGDPPEWEMRLVTRGLQSLQLTLK